jgi:micrococcal nuclease
MDSRILISSKTKRLGWIFALLFVVCCGKPGTPGWASLPLSLAADTTTSRPPATANAAILSPPADSDSESETNDELAASAISPFRKWSSHGGKYTIEAALIGLSVESAVLEKFTGHRTTVPLQRLSDPDVEYLKQFQFDLVAKCVGISDGDTITVLDANKRQVKIRLEGIDAPEGHQDFGTESRHHTAELVFQKEVRIQRRGLDKYGRTLGHVYVGDLWINQDLVRNGLAWHYKQYSADPRLAQAEDLARKQQIGIWSRKDAVAPWEFRHKPKPQAIVGDPKPAPPKPPPSVESRSVDRSGSETGERTATGIPIHTGPRGGKFHYSKSGKKVYERKKK